MTRPSELRNFKGHHPHGGAVATLVFLSIATLCAPRPAVASDEIHLVVETISPSLWVADARGMTLEFRLEGSGESARLLVRFVGVDGGTVAPPPARSVTLISPNAKIAFETSGQTWISTTAAEPLLEGSLLSIVEGDHHHDFRLNIHDEASVDAPAEAQR